MLSVVHSVTEKALSLRLPKKADLNHGLKFHEISNASNLTYGEVKN